MVLKVVIGLVKSKKGKTKGKPKEEASEELADLLILILGHSLAMHIDLESEFHSKMDKIMQRKARRGNLGIRVTEYEGE